MLHDTDLARGHIDDAAGNEERRDLAGAPSQHFGVVFFDGLDATDSGTHCDTDCMAVLLGNLEVRVPDRIDRRGNTVVDKRIVLALIFPRQIVIDIESP